jgi:hypothetical protein
MSLECEFSDPIPATAAIASKNAKFIASASGVKLTLRDLNSLKVLHIFTCIDKIEK